MEGCWGFPKIKGTILRVPTIRLIQQHLGVYIGVPVFMESTTFSTYRSDRSLVGGLAVESFNNCRDRERLSR